MRTTKHSSQYSAQYPSIRQASISHSSVPHPATRAAAKQSAATHLSVPRLYAVLLSGFIVVAAACGTESQPKPSPDAGEQSEDAAPKTFTETVLSVEIKLNLPTDTVLTTTMDITARDG